MSTESREREVRFFQGFKQAVAKNKALARNCLA